MGVRLVPGRLRPIPERQQPRQHILNPIPLLLGPPFHELLGLPGSDLREIEQELIEWRLPFSIVEKSFYKDICSDKDRLTFVNGWITDD